ncbi:MAG: tetratricopeptide repeat protein, partial [Armatimonadetes bacterium]|nr:tetratricopeptide repeat protein [Armatimonadota bacterium]NIO97140.1 tetratricopeptide repeat protein [Armatimonadota bacterium]
AAFGQGVAGTLNNLGNLLRELGDGARAREAFEEALPLATRGEPLLPPMIMTNLGVLLYEEGQDKKGMGLAWKAVRQIERMLSDPHYAEVRYSFKGEIEDAYRLVLCDPELERDTPRARRLLEAMRVGEALGELRHEDAPHFLIDEALEGEHGTVLTIQRIHDGLLFLATLRTETIFERTDASWIEAGKKLLEEVQSQEALKQGGTERIAAAGHELWKTLPASVQRLLPEDSSSGIALSLDPEVGVLPLEFLTPTGKPEDFLCLKMEMPRVPGERLFRQCQERNVIDGAGEYCTLVFGNPTKDLKYAQSEALTIASHLSKNGFRPAFGDKETLIGDDAKMPKFLEALEAHPT